MEHLKAHKTDRQTHRGTGSDRSTGRQGGRNTGLQELKMTEVVKGKWGRGEDKVTKRCPKQTA